MKKYLIAFLLLSSGGIIYLSLALHTKDKFVSIDNNKFNNDDFVSLKGNKFNLKGKDFYPLIVNYLGALQTDGREIWARPSVDYSIDSLHEPLTKDSSMKELRADLNLIRQMGFNAVRVVGIGEVTVHDSDRVSDLSLEVYKGNGNWSSINLDDTASYKSYFNALAGLFNEINNAGLKVILLVRTRPYVITTENFLAMLTHYFQNDATILAYDLYNEPLYFDKSDRSKKDVYETTRKWMKICKKNSPRHLITIGMQGIREVFAWDPNVVNVDFLSFHPYDHEPEQVRNEIYWYNKYVKKPWIIGETAIPADNDSVSYEEQKLFAAKTLRQAYNCGASGYSWWQYKDVHWPKFHSSFMGVVNRKGITNVGNDLKVNGTVKPVAEEFKKFNSTSPKENCLCLNNYYNYSQHHEYRIIGRLIDNHNKPIEGGVFMAWNNNWLRSYHTITRADGTFELMGDFPFYHWIVSACEYSMLRGDIELEDTKHEYGNAPTVNVGDVKLNNISF